jgi:hypothetical protein
MSSEGALIVLLLAAILGWMVGGWIGLVIAVGVAAVWPA